MGVQDRDWWRNRRDKLHPDDPRGWGRRKTAGATKPSPKRPRAGLIWLLIIAGLVLWYAHSSRRDAPVVASTAKSNRAIGPAHSCDDALPIGAWTTKSVGARDESANSRAQIVNGTSRDRVLDLLTGNELLISIALPAGQSSALDLPIGTYQWRLRHGAAWCSRQQQFVREVQTNVARPLEIVASSRLTIQVDDDAIHPSGLRIKTSDEPVVSVSGRGAVTAYATMRPDGVYVLRRSDRGPYLIEGSIDGITLQFMVDTGATMVAIPETLAHRLGHYRGREVVIQTANGPATGFEFVAREVLFGPFVANDVSVLALPNLPQPLLGMSLLGAMNLRQTPQGLALSAGR